MIEKNATNITIDTIGGGNLLRSGGFATYTTQATQAACASVFSLMKSPNGQCRRVKIDNNGDFQKTSIICPENE